MHQTYLAFDLGAESGRGVLADFNGEKITLREVGRFSTSRKINVADFDGVHRWDFSVIAAEMSSILYRCESEAAGPLSGTAVDTWGVDFGLLDSAGNLLENPVWYRDHSHGEAMLLVLSGIPGEALWEQSGIQLMPFNTLFQLAARKKHNPELLERAESLLFMPDLLASTLMQSQLRSSELTIASTSQMLNPRTHQWNTDLISALSLPTQMLQPIVSPGTKGGMTKNGTPVYAAARHDTASAVAAVPAGDDTTWAFISSGTWSLVGVERTVPELSLEAFALGLSNEIGIEGRTRLLKNIMGLWLVQECRRSLMSGGENYAYEHLTALAGAAPPNGPLIDAANQRFLAPDDMPAEIRAACIESGQRPPETVGELIRCCLDSLALAYRKTLADIERLLDIKFDVIHVVGGGSKNAVLNRLTADACGIPVIAGPDEATAAGNALSQLVGSGAVNGWVEARTVCRNSFTPVTFYPQPSAQSFWLEREEVIKNFS